jgi:prepilin-type N-terminal cleavage/methylation domain-containing protein
MTNPADNPESGFTLIELLVASLMMVIVTGAAVTMLISVMHREPKVTSRANEVASARIAIEKITADLREGEELTAFTPNSATVTTVCGPGEGAGMCTVTYQCPAEIGEPTFECVRESAARGRVTLLKGLASPAVFCYYPNTAGVECGEVGIGTKPLYVGIKLQFPQENAPTNSILEGGVALHNAPSLLKGPTNG